MTARRPILRRVRAASLLTLAVSGLVSVVGAREDGLALRAAKVITCAEPAMVLEGGTVLLRDGKIEGLLPSGAPLPEGYLLRDFGDAWLMPGMIDLHTHVAGGGVNDAVFQANPGLRATATVVPGNASLQRALAAGVTTMLFIPGSATTVGGQGVLLKTAPKTYEAMVLRDPGSLKVAQADNPKRWGYGMNRIMLNWSIRETFREGRDYAQAWSAFEAGDGPEPERSVSLDIFRNLFAHELQISAHTQVHQVVLASMQIMREEFGLDLYIDHGTFDAYKAAGIAEALGVPAIIGPRSVNQQNKGRKIDTDGAIMGVAAEYQRRGHTRIGFNTDAPVVPAEELPLQAAMGVRFGFDDSALGTLRGLTIVPAEVAGVDHRVGSLAVGKDADLVVISGHPSDPRSGVECVFVDGHLVYDAENGRTF